ncbi:unnamed protein product [Paramecium sonneborni]|uniref:Uncharacterized protein n=1 Tax=Paramecium sonneborni TaxID=65129 RepID=A0A8S1RT06_9CILI|nr:unnamed protein product [Paramecium sonneborni]
MIYIIIKRMIWIIIYQIYLFLLRILNLQGHHQIIQINLLNNLLNSILRTMVNSSKCNQLQMQLNKKFEEQYNDNNELQQLIEQIQILNIKNIDTKKECFKINILEQKVCKKNAPLIYKIGNKISFEQIDQQYADFFKKENNFTVIGSIQQISIFRTILIMIEQIIKELKKELGIIEGQIKKINIIYNKYSEEIFPMDKATPIKIKGSKQNIESTVSEISKILKTLCVQRLYIIEMKLKLFKKICIIQNNMLRFVNIEINHPFFYIQYREKEVCLIGNLQQIQETSNAIKLLLEQETNITYFIVLISPQFKEQCKQVKQRIEKDYHLQKYYCLKLHFLERI